MPPLLAGGKPQLTRHSAASIGNPTARGVQLVISICCRLRVASCPAGLL